NRRELDHVNPSFERGAPMEYTPKEYHDPWKALRRLQPEMEHPAAPEPEECMEVEKVIEQLMEVPHCAGLLKQEGVRASFFGAMVAQARAHSSYYLQDERVMALFYYMKGWKMVPNPRSIPHPSLSTQGLFNFTG
ncbi:MAG: hypothetical protein SGPRY_005101, partial [Prymnesium sp.]